MEPKQTKVKIVKVDKNTISISFPSGTKAVISEDIELETLLQFLAPGGREAYKRIFSTTPLGPNDPPKITLFKDSLDE